MKSTRGTSTRLDWRDPDMPVTALNGLDIGFGFSMGDLTPEQMQHFAQQSLAYPNPECPPWWADPTYNMRSKHVELPKKKAVDV